MFFGGGWGNNAAVIDNGDSVMLDNGVIGNSGTAGMRIAGANPTLAGDTFQNNSGPALSMDLASDPNITGASVINKNQINGVVLDSGSLSGNESWNNPDIVYWIRAASPCRRGIP